ncbi:MAG: hypothetical protein BJ554DRAFT_3340, partial [Olpidium bornovanus]
ARGRGGAGRGGADGSPLSPSPPPPVPPPRPADKKTGTGKARPARVGGKEGSGRRVPFSDLCAGSGIFYFPSLPLHLSPSLALFPPSPRGLSGASVALSLSLSALLPHRAGHQTNPFLSPQVVPGAARAPVPGRAAVLPAALRAVVLPEQPPVPILLAAGRPAVRHQLQLGPAGCGRRPCSRRRRRRRFRRRAAATAGRGAMLAGP